MICEILTNHHILEQLSSKDALSFDHRVCFHQLNIFIAQGSDQLFLPKSVVTTLRGQNIICSKTHLDHITHEQTIMRTQLFKVSRPMKSSKKIVE